MAYQENFELIQKTETKYGQTEQKSKDTETRKMAAEQNRFSQFKLLHRQQHSCVSACVVLFY